MGTGRSSDITQKRSSSTSGLESVRAVCTQISAAADCTVRCRSRSAPTSPCRTKPLVILGIRESATESAATSAQNCLPTSSDRAAAVSAASSGAKAKRI